MTGLKIFTTIMASASAFAFSTTILAAQSAMRPEHAGGGGRPGGNPNVASVPEIDASTGLLSIAAVLAVIAFVWERNRRKQA